MNHGYDLDKWRDQLPDTKLALQAEDIRLKSNQLKKPVDVTKLQLDESEFTLNDQELASLAETSENAENSELV